MTIKQSKEENKPVDGRNEKLDEQLVLFRGEV
jgi:hypothetical protein